MARFKRYTVTSALPYANGPLHIGQLAGAYVPADIYVRYLRLKGEDVAFICGSDEHGVAITLKALNEDTTPQAIIDRFHALNKKSFEDFGIGFDIYHRTSEPLHHETAKDFFLRLHEKGEFTTETSEQYFDEDQGMFLADRYIMGTCPRCGNESAYGDQCEKCGSTLSPKDLINPRSTISGNPPVLRTTTHWYLPMQRYEAWLREWILEGHSEWKKNVYGQVKSWLDQGLQPRAMTRDLDWGVPVPLPEGKGKVLYVWLDAPIGYISATKAWAEASGKDWKHYWQNEDTRLVHFIGKDNIVFHCIIFPIILKAHGDFILPDNVPANEFMNMEGDKISTSRNWAVWLHEYLEEFPGKQDVLRYVLTANMPETKDSEFTWKDYQDRNNSELVGILGNFINRVLVLQQKYFEGSVQPGGPVPEALNEVFSEGGFRAAVEQSLEQFRFREALAAMMDMARAGNKYLTDEEPWKRFKDDPTAVGTVLNHCLQVMANLAIAMAPFLPQTSNKLVNMLGIEPGEISWGNLGRADLVPAGRVLKQPELLFDKVDDAVIEAQVAKLQATKQPTAPEAASETAPLKAEIVYDDFAKLDLRTGRILEAAKVPKADKLLHLKVDLGFEVRDIVSGIAEHFDPADLIGMQVVVVANLAPRKLRGIESQGMILMAEGKGGRLVFVQPGEEVEPGSGVN